jgi:GTP-binding protein
VLADLPGYGYAAVPLADKLRWQRVMANYLVSAPTCGRHGADVRPAPGPDRAGRALLDVIRPRVEQG